MGGAEGWERGLKEPCLLEEEGRGVRSPRRWGSVQQRAPLWCPSRNASLVQKWVINGLFRSGKPKLNVPPPLPWQAGPLPRAPRALGRDSEGREPPPTLLFLVWSSLQALIPMTACDMEGSQREEEDACRAVWKAPLGTAAAVTWK